MVRRVGENGESRQGLASSRLTQSVRASVGGKAIKLWQSTAVRTVTSAYCLPIKAK